MIEDRIEMINLRFQSLSKPLATEPQVIAPSQLSRYHTRPCLEEYAFSCLTKSRTQKSRLILRIRPAVLVLHMVGRVGFEPTTNWLKANCSTN